MFVSPGPGASRRGETGHSQRLWEAGSVCLGGVWEGLHGQYQDSFSAMLRNGN